MCGCGGSDGFDVRRAAVMAVVALVLVGSVARGEPASYVWVEAEEPASANFEFDTGAGKAHLLSGRKWLLRFVSKEEVSEQLPEEGFLLSYDLEVPEDGEYEVWARVGLEWIRSSFEWRIGQGNWHRAGRDEQTTNVMELAEWNEVAWLYLGRAALKGGAADLRVRYREPNPGDDGRIVIALDCFVLTRGHFFPEGNLKPGQAYTGEADAAAAAHVFQFPEPAGPADRVRLKLSGLWQVARYDDSDMDKGTYVPVQSLPSPHEYPLRWMGIEVPGSLWDKDETVFAHRVLYRTRVDVPPAYEGRGFHLHFSGTNWIVSVFVNGELAGTHRGVWIPWDLDISDYVAPGEVNEIAVAVKGPYYAVDTKYYQPDRDLDYQRNRPRTRQSWVYYVAPIYPSTKGDGNGVDYGIVNPVTLVATGDAYTEDVFIKPSVRRKRLEADVTVLNTRDTERKFQVRCDAVYDRDDRVEKSFGPVDVTVRSESTAVVTVAGDWADPKLWWPAPDPHLYRLRTTVLEDGKPVDVQEELFGFREVTVRGPGIYINGVRRNFWNWVNVRGRTWDPQQWLRMFSEEGNRFTRFSRNRHTSAFLPTREERLEFYDRNGIAGRLCSMIDGMFINCVLGNRSRNPVTDEPLLYQNDPVWEGFKRHMDQLTRAYRNHPSVIFYQVENELVYITGMNIYGAYLDRIEELMNEVIEVARMNDPTRPYTVGGAGDLSGKLEINSPHYPAGSLDWYPENAYTLDKYATKISRWPWDRRKPWVVGESAFARELGYGSYVLGDEVFRSRHDANRGKAGYLRMLYGGYRWAGVAGFFPWDNLWNHEDAQKVFSDLCAIPRKQTHRLRAGEKNDLLFKIMNDTLSRERVTFEWTYEAGGSKIAGQAVTMRIEPGFGEQATLTIEAPETDARLDGTLSLNVTQPGAKDYVDVRSVPVLPRVRALDVKAPVTVLDRSGKLEAFLTATGTRFDGIEKLADAGPKTGLLLIGPDTLTPAEAFGQDILAFAARGGCVIVLEQEVPAGGGSLPAPLTTTTHQGGYAHPKALGTSVFRDLGKEDLIDWAAGHPTYKNVYRKPTQGARSLAECGEMLALSPLIEMPCGKGVIVLCQLCVGANLGVDAAADILLRNLVETYAGYQSARGVAAVYAPENRLLVDTVTGTGALSEAVRSLEAALDAGKYRVAVVHATERNMAALNGLGDGAAAFQDAGGWIMLNGLEPAGLAEFNRFLGTDHMIRPFRIERVTLEGSDHPLAATLGNRDLAMFSPRPLQHGRMWISGNVFSYVIDGFDAAPFAQMPGGPEDPYVYEPTFDDHDPYNYVNGMLNSDFWRYIRQIWIPEEGPEPITFRFRRPEIIKQVNIWNNANYWTIEDLDIIFDGDEANAVRVTLPDGGELTEVELAEPRRVERALTLQIRTWRERRLDRPDLRLVGVDNVQFVRAEMPPGAVSLDNVGGLVAFPRGAGGVILNQVKFMADEPNPANASAKVGILGVLLQNMGVGSRASSVAVPGVNVRYDTLDITDYCTQYMKSREGKSGWFGYRGRDLANVQVGERVLADVTYHLVDYATAPVPDCIVLGADDPVRDLPKQVEGIKVARKADVLFFLQAAHVRRPIRDDERARIGARRNPFSLPEVMKYVIHYADGGTAEIPVLLDKHVEHWEQETPGPLEGAAVALAFNVPGLEGRKGVLYGMKVSNPRPDVEIATIDIVLGRDSRRAIPVVLAITLGTILE